MKIKCHFMEKNNIIATVVCVYSSPQLCISVFCKCCFKGEFLQGFNLAILAKRYE